MKLNIILLISFLASIINGCCKTCMPKEKINVPQSTRSGIKYVHNKTDLRRIAWWEKLEDPLLNQLISQALQYNNQIKSSYATIEQAQAQLKSAQYAWIPTLDATANGFTGGTWNTHITPQGNLVNNPFFKNVSNLRFKGYYTGFVPGYTFNILNNINNIKSAKASLAIQKAQAQSTKLGIISQIAGTYFMLLSQREQLTIEKILSQDLKKLRKLEQVRFQKGASDIGTIINIDQQIAQEDSRIPQIENVVAQSENTIQLLLNENPNPITTKHTLLSLNINNLIPKYLPSSVLKNRPDIIIAANNLKVACAQIGIAYSAFFPTISLTGLVGNVSLDLTNLLKLNANTWIARASGSSTLFNLSSYQKIKAAKAGFKATYYDYLESLRSAFKDVDDALTTEQNNKLTFEQTEKSYVAAKKAYRIALVQYKAGKTDYRNVINTKINLDRSQLTLIQEKAQLLDSIVQVYQAVAGGYNVA